MARHDSLWERVDALLDPPSDPRERRLENVLDRKGELDDGGPEELEEIAKQISNAIMEHRRDWPMEPGAASGELLIVEPANDRDYWRLLADLDQRESSMMFPSDRQPYPWKPVTVSWRTSIFGDSASRQARVTLEFDHRFSQRSLVAQLRRLWPMFVNCGYVRRTRPLKLKATKLIRLICLELPPGTNWVQRLTAWNRRYGRKHGRYDDIFPFQRDFRRAERQVTGERYGLEYLYNPIAQLSDNDLLEQRERGDRDALAYYQRLHRRRMQRRDASLRVQNCAGAPPAWDERPLDRRSRK